MEKGNLSKKTEYTKAEMQTLIDNKTHSLSDRLDSLSGSIDYIGEKQAVHDNEYTALKKSTEADIEALKTDTASLKTGVSDINEQISSIKGQLNTYGSVLTSHENSIQNLISDKADKSDINSLEYTINNLDMYKAQYDLSNVEDSVFLEKINAVLADGDEVSY